MQAILEPLKPGDERYTDLNSGRKSNDLKKLEQYIRNCQKQGRNAVATLTGHRGCGKSTELQRLIEDVKADFEPFYVEVDATRLMPQSSRTATTPISSCG